MPLKVNSEIGKLSSVLVHLPGPEIDRMIPAMMEELSLRRHPLRQRGRGRSTGASSRCSGYVADEVLEVQELLDGRPRRSRSSATRSWQDLGRVLDWGPDMDYRLRDLTSRRSSRRHLVTGIEKPAPEDAQSSSELYWLPPIPNYFFQRDPLVVVGDRAIRGSMATPARLREPLLSGYIVRYHPRFARPDEDRFWFQEFSADYGRPSSYARMRPTLEGGDILVLREDLLAIGYSERTRRPRSSGWRRSLQDRGSPVRRHLRGRDSAGALLHAPGHGLHDDLAGRVPGLRAR